MTKKIAHIILFSLFTILVSSYVVNQYSHIKKDTLTNVEEQIEKEASNHDNYLLANDFFIFHSFINKVFLFIDAQLSSEILLKSQGNRNSSCQPQTALCISLCTFRI